MNNIAFVPYSIPWGSKELEGIYGEIFPIKGEKDLEARVLIAMVSQNNEISFCYEVYHKDKGVLGIVTPKAVPRDGPEDAQRIINNTYKIVYFDD